ncbi:hypothetical protein JAAARDRAFT_69904 [Jaapia argillacea MUCL 33604]|uniref:Uncharacterized protein n=1 Tax=Jaapia argillacea MUCL 33604 TaxID=933084 RepID=A0A067Q5F9_9AGAM|nr:hypothetical protein JAAARDRAFT_69904 [Jaapia argillacea MUCL 33604]
MIRRNPTLIAMTDMDVQEIRRLVEQKKKETEAAATLAANMSNTKGKGKDTSHLPYVAAEDSKRKRDGMSRDERLGLR